LDRSLVVQTGRARAPSRSRSFTSVQPRHRRRSGCSRRYRHRPAAQTIVRVSAELVAGIAGPACDRRRPRGRSDRPRSKTAASVSSQSAKVSASSRQGNRHSPGRSSRPRRRSRRPRCRRRGPRRPGRSRGCPRRSRRSTGLAHATGAEAVPVGVLAGRVCAVAVLVERVAAEVSGRRMERRVVVVAVALAHRTAEVRVVGGAGDGRRLASGRRASAGHDGAPRIAVSVRVFGRSELDEPDRVAHHPCDREAALAHETRAARAGRRSTTIASRGPPSRIAMRERRLADLCGGLVHRAHHRRRRRRAIEQDHRDRQIPTSAGDWTSSRMTFSCCAQPPTPLASTAAPATRRSEGLQRAPSGPVRSHVGDEAGPASEASPEPRGAR
jgi:hypothetical protein